MNRQEKIILFLLSALNFTHIMDFMIMMPLGVNFMKAFNINAQQFSFLVASYSIAAFFSSLFASSIADNYDRKKILLFGYTGFTIATIACGLAPTFHWLMMARITAGLFGGLIGAQVQSIVADIFEYERRGRAMGYIMTALSLASAFGVPLGYYIANHSSWHVPFFIVGGFSLLLLPFLFKYVPSVNKHLHIHTQQKPHLLQVFRQVFSDKVQLNALALSGFLMMGHFIIIPFLIPYLELNVGFTKEQTPLFYVVGGIMTFIASPYIGKMADKYGKMRVFRFFVLGSLPFIFVITHLPQMTFYYVLAITGVWFVFSTGRGIPAQAMVSNVVEPAHRGSFMSINASMQQLFVGSASLIAGMIVSTGPDGKILHYPVVGYISMAIVGLCLVIVGFLQKRIREVEEETEIKPLEEIPEMV